MSFPGLFIRLPPQDLVKSSIRYLFYQGLLNHESVLRYENIMGVQNNLLFINHGHTEDEVEHLKSKANTHEAEFTKALCRYFLQQGYDPSRITILTGYAGQLIKLKNIMPKKDFEGVRVTVVDNFQGEENDIIILSLVRSNFDGKIGFLKTENRICVALSRAKIGLYVIGNFDFLEEESGMWKNIVTDMRDRECLQDHLTLQCQNHPRTVVEVKEAKDFTCAPEGGCTLPCEFRLKCGHVCQMACHPTDQDHEKYVCRKKCLKRLPCNHDCSYQCHHGEECGGCQILVRKVISKCGHTHKMKCCLDPNDFYCSVKCERVRKCGHKCTRSCGDDCEEFPCKALTEKTLQCSHRRSVACSQDTQEVRCIEKCTVKLDCLHQCGGTCGRCFRGRLHVKCSQPCERILVCSHRCKEPCVSECPPCKAKCGNSCVHSRCSNDCGAACTPCNEPCVWKCVHLRCTRLCGEICDRERCNEPCTKKLKKCGHLCLGLCGEPCPPLCRVCNEKDVREIFFGNEDEDDARFVQLKDCGHVFEVEGMDRWMETDTTEQGSIKLKECPKCKVPIRKSARYGNLVKAVFADIEEVKKRINLTSQQTDIHRLRNQGYNSCNALWGQHHLSQWGDTAESFPSKTDLTTSYKSLKSQYPCVRLVALLFRAGASEVARYVNMIHTLENVYKLKAKVVGSRSTLVKLIDHLMNFLAERVSDQQLQQAGIELQRLYLFYNVNLAKQHFERISKLEGQARVDSDYVDQQLKILTEGEQITPERIKETEEKLKVITKRYNVGGLTQEERRTIVNAIGLGKGHWFKCPNGHYYAIGECGGANQQGRCPEPGCGSAIGGASHALAAGNWHAPEFDGSQHAAYSEAANNMMNIEEIRNLLH